MEKYLARQPIFDALGNVFGYEMLFRSSLENFFRSAQSDLASASTADNLFLFGLDRLTEGRLAFVNCTRDCLVREYPTLLSAIDAILDMPMTDVLKEIAVGPEIRAALLGEMNRYRKILDLVVMYETGAWEGLSERAAQIGIGEDAVPEMFFQSLEWAKKILAGEQMNEPESAASANREPAR